jgi:hypothetical protein
MNAPLPQARRRRQVAIPQATLLRAGRVAKQLGPEWQVVIEGDAVRLFQEAPPQAPVAPDKRWRL